MSVSSRFRQRRTLYLLVLASTGFLFACQMNVRKRTERLPWHEARQLVLVTTRDWSANTGNLSTYSWQKSDWQSTGLTTQVTIGRSGAAWGLGLHSLQPGRQKQEGDGRSPAGVFGIGPAFGYAESSATSMPYLPMQDSNYCVDVPASPFYNQIVDTREVGDAAVVGTTEPMRRDLYYQGDQLYKSGFVIEHNSRQVAGAGSCIFAHLWRGENQATAGCTAMAEVTMTALLDWLRPDQQPVFILLPEVEYRRLQKVWQLPQLVLTNSRPE